MRFGGLIAAIVFAAVMAVIVLRMSADTAPVATTTSSAPQLKSASIYVAAQPIPIGSTITQEMVSVQAWPEHLMLEGFIRAEGTRNPVGMIARAPFQAQEPILSSKVTNAQDPNFLAGSLPKGMRILTIQTNEIEGLAGFVFPGDRVDILLTHDVERWSNPPAVLGRVQPAQRVTDAITETLLTNVTVMAVDQRASSANAVDKNGNLIVPRSVSLMVSPTDAQRLRLAAREGTLTLALRSLEDRESADPLILTGFRDISQYVDRAAGDSTDAVATGGGVLVIRGIASETSESVAAMPAAPLPTPDAPTGR